MIISNIDLQRTGFRPAEYYSPPIIDPDAMKALELPLQGFEPVSGWGREVTQSFSIIQEVELPSSNFLDAGPPNAFAESVLIEDPFNRWIGEALDRHRQLYHGEVYRLKVFRNQVAREGKPVLAFARAWQQNRAIQSTRRVGSIPRD